MLAYLFLLKSTLASAGGGEYIKWVSVLEWANVRIKSYLRVIISVDMASELLA